MTRQWESGVGLWLGLSLCVPHQCHCGSTVDAQWLYSFGCKKASEDRPGTTLCDLVARAMVSAGISVTKEPHGLSRSDRKWPDSLSLVPWDVGKPLSWMWPSFVRCLIHMLPQQPWGWFSSRGGSCSEVGEIQLVMNRIFSQSPLSFCDRFNAPGCTFLKNLSRKLCVKSSDVRETSFFCFSKSLFWFSVLMLFYCTTVSWTKWRRGRSNDHFSLTFFLCIA